MIVEMPRKVPYDDAAARDRIRNSLDETLMVEAAAGTGKTTELVRRVLNVLRTGRTTIDRIVAVTFTHKAAGELKLRLRQELDRARTNAEGDERSHLEAALEHLEEAAIGTIHSFCAQILRERPVEARVDPAFGELSEPEAARMFDRAFRGWFQTTLNASPPGLRRALARLAWRDSFGEERSPVEQLQFAARTLIEWRDYPAEWSMPDFSVNGAIDAAVARLLEAASRVSKAFKVIGEFSTWVTRAEALRPRDYATLEALLLKLLRDLKKIKRKGAEEYIRMLEEFKSNADADLAARLRDEMAGVIERYDELKRRAGKLDFLDLLLLARNLVRDDAVVRAYLQDRFSHIFVDEFQDTDPLQAEIILLLAADSEDCAGWLEAAPKPGKLFVVGDPKQSIYKFRRADVVLYEQIKRRLTSRGAGVVYLSKSFRGVRPIQECVNAAFEPEMTGDMVSGQAHYVSLEEHAQAPEGQPSVVALPAPKPYGTRRISRAAIDACLPDVICAYVEWLLKESGWTVRAGDGSRRVPIEEAHICLLFRRMINFGDDITRPYTRSLEARGIRHLLVGSKSFHHREEVETLRAALTAVEWPDDELSVYATLRGGLFAIPDSALLRWKTGIGSLHPFRALPGKLDSDMAAIGEALPLLAGLHRARNRRPVAETVNLLLEATRAHAGFALRPAGQQVLANVHRIADLARTFELSGGISFRGFVEELEAQAQRAEAAEAPVLEEGAEGVRLMTVHSAKGLEFPVVILADITARLAAAEPERYVDGEKRLCAMRLMRCAPLDLMQHLQEERVREASEGVRVVYVAATRARDLLVVPAVGDEPLDGWAGPLNKAIYPSRDGWRSPDTAQGCPKFGDVTTLERPPEYVNEPEFSVKPGLHRPRLGSHSVVWWDPSKLRLGVEGEHGLRQNEIIAAKPADRAKQSEDDYREWRIARQDLLQRGEQPRYDIFTASEVSQRPPGFSIDVAVETVLKTEGRPMGPRFGSLVHAILRDAPFDADAARIDGLTRVQARVFGATEGEEVAAARAVGAALAHPLIGRASSAARVYREYPVLMPVEGRMLEGVIDLAFVDNGAWTVVDFKTDADLPARQSHYKTQLLWYAYAISRATGMPVAAVLLSV